MTPTIPLTEDFADLGVLGNINEPLLSTALGYISANGRMMRQQPERTFKYFKDVKQMKPFGTEMYLDEVPEGLIELLK